MGLLEVDMLLGFWEIEVYVDCDAVVVAVVDIAVTIADAGCLLVFAVWEW